MRENSEREIRRDRKKRMRKIQENGGKNQQNGKEFKVGRERKKSNRKIMKEKNHMNAEERKKKERE